MCPTLHRRVLTTCAHSARYVLLKERNLLATERAAARTAREKFLNPLRLGKVRCAVPL